MADAPRPPVEIELDIDKEPALAREMSVLSLPTTFILDGGLEETVPGVRSAIRSRSESCTRTTIRTPRAKIREFGVNSPTCKPATS